MLKAVKMTYFLKPHMMKKQILPAAAFTALLFITIPFYKLEAQPYLGGEITWECTSQGNFRFVLKLYRDCAMVNYGYTQYLVSNAPGFSNINMTRIAINEISPICGCPGGTPITCSPEPTLGQTGAVQEHVYTSDGNYPNGVPLVGVPPPGGWYFANSTCCRTSSSNIANGPSLSYFIRVIMYPYKNTPVNTCFDNGPEFVEKPASIICTGYDAVLDYSARDHDNDLLAYDWAYPLSNNINTPVTSYSTGYSYNAPLPGTWHHSSNKQPLLDHQNGYIEFRSFIPGSFTIVVKATSHKDGIIVSEAFREFVIVLKNCDPGNAPPLIGDIFPLNPGATTDTVNVGDSVTFWVSGIDTAKCPGTSPPVQQTLYLSASGDQFGVPVNTSGCLMPPCASLTPSPTPTVPVSGQMGIVTQFAWKTSCDHIVWYNDTTIRNRYSFLFAVRDDFCPIPMANYALVTIVIIPKPKIPLSPPITCVSVHPDGDVDISWQKVIDSLNTFDGYILFTSDSPSGTYIPVDTINDINILSSTHIKGSDGTGPVYYYLAVMNKCSGDGKISKHSDTVSTINLKTKLLSVWPQVTELQWNHPLNPMLPDSSASYNVFRRVAPGQWSVIAETTQPHFIDTIGLMPVMPEYYIAYTDTSSTPVPCIMFSNTSSPTISVEDIGVVDIVYPVNDTIAGSLVNLKIAIANFGTDPQVSVPVSLFIDSVHFLSEYWTGLLPPYDTVHHTFTMPYTVPASNHNICVGTALLTDTASANNSFCKSFGYISGTGSNELKGFTLGNNIPNPAKHSTIIPFTVPEAGGVILSLSDLTGKTILTSTHPANAGNNRIEADIRSLSPGIYFYTVTWQTFSITRKMVVAGE